MILEDTYTWEKITQWHFVLPPSRPSLYHINLIESEINNFDRNSPVAILGCTPELRDLFSRMNFKNAYLFDKSKIVFDQMTSLRCFNTKENFIHGDWFDSLPQYTNYFKVILSDLTSGNISYSMQPEFYSIIAKSLEKKGIFIDKILTHQGPKRQLNTLKKKYSELPLNLLYVNYFSCEFLFCSELLDINNILDSSFFYEYLSKDFKCPVLLKFLSESPKITPFQTVWYYGKNWTEICDYYFQSLKKVKLFEEEKNSPYYGNLKIIISEKR